MPLRPTRLRDRLWRHGLGVHLIRGTPVNKDKSSIVPQSNHLSFLVSRKALIRLCIHHYQALPRWWQPCV